jgi:O-antigen ligase
MSSIAAPKTTSAVARTLRPGVVEAMLAAMPTIVAALLFTVLLIGFQPFAAGEVLISADAPTGGNRANQIGFSLVGAVTIMALLTLAKPGRLLSLPTAGWALVTAIYLMAVALSPERMVALRVMGFSFIAVLAMIAVVILSRDARVLQNVVATGAIAVLGLSYFGVFVFPEAARHTAELFEPANEGLWRGIYQHKNAAGPVMAGFVFAGVWLVRSGRFALGAAILVLAGFFLLQSGSKTSAGTVLLVLMIVLLPSLFGLRGLAVALATLVFAVFGIFTVGTVLSDALRDIMLAAAPGNTFTGRTTLWAFSIEMIGKSPWVGHGLESLWAKPAVMQMERPFDAEWDFRGIVHGHSSYLDSMLDLGVPGFCILAAVLLVQPIIDYLRARRLRANILAADFFLMVLVFAALNAFMETFFFKRADPVWMLMVLAIAGLRLAATEPMTRGAANGG